MKPLKIVSAILILLISLPFSAKSQTISIDSKKICFDSAAAVNVMQDIEVRESIIQLYIEELDKCDSINIVLKNELYAKNDSLKYLQYRYKEDLSAEKKKTKTYKKITALSILIAIVAKLIKK